MSGYNFVAERPVERYRKSDLSFVAAVIILTGLGLFTLYFCSQNYAGRIFRDTLYFVRRQSISIAVGTAGFILFASLRMDAVRRLLPIMMGAALILCLLTFVPGISVEKNGARFCLPCSRRKWLSSCSFCFLQIFSINKRHLQRTGSALFFRAW